VNEGDAQGLTPPASARGWYPVPGNPNYQRFWNGQSWSSERYEGGAGLQASGHRVATSESPRDVPRPPTNTAQATSRVLPRQFDHVQYQGSSGPPLNPRSPARHMAVSLGAITLMIVMTFVLHVFQVRLFVALFGLGLIVGLLQLRPKVRFLRDPVRQSAIHEPIVFTSRVNLRFVYTPYRWPTPIMGRWDLAVRTDSLQVTNWVWGSRGRAQTTFFYAPNCVMWRAGGSGDGIVVSGPTYLRSRVEFVFSTGAQDQLAWDALAGAGVRPVESRREQGTDGRVAPASGMRAFTRVGNDLGSAAPVPAAASRPGGLRAPRRARAPWAWIVGAILFVVVAPWLLMLLTGGIPHASTP
jgi:hypothetical protein